MKAEKIVVTNVRAGIPAGMRLRLSEKQAAVRRHNIKEIDKGVFEALKPLEFKRGEEFEIITGDDAPEPSKALRAQISTPEEAAKKPAAPAKDAAAKKPAAGKASKETKESDENSPVPGSKILDPTA